LGAISLFLEDDAAVLPHVDDATVCLQQFGTNARLQSTLP
jgi:hypothetical protein